MRRDPLARSERSNYIKIKRYEEEEEEEEQQQKVEKKTKIKQRELCQKISKLESNIVMSFRCRAL